MKVAVVGNCQIAAVRSILTCIHADLESPLFPSVYDLNEAFRASVEQELEAADWIFTQPIQDNYPVEYARTSRLREVYGAKLVVWPNCYFTGYAPEWDTLPSPEHENFAGPLLGYHSSKIIHAFFKGYTVEKTKEFVDFPSEFDKHHYSDAVYSSLRELREREKSTDVTIADYIEDNYRTRRLFHIMNHPGLDVMIAVCRRLLSRIGERYHDPQPDYLTEFDLISARYPENPYLYEIERMSFPRDKLYRGAIFKPGDTPTGFTAVGAKLYNTAEIVEAFFALYEKNRNALESHWRVTKIMDGSP